MESLMRLVADKLAGQLVERVKLGLSPIGPYLRRLSVGVLLILLSLPLWLAGLLSLLISLYLTLANFGNFLVPALGTGGASFLTALILTVAGLSMLRPPR